MRQYPPDDAPLSVQVDAEGRPALITWRGQPDRVTSIEDVCEPRLDWWAPGGAIHRVYYLVTTERGAIAEIYHDRAGGGWYLARTFD